MTRCYDPDLLLFRLAIIGTLVCGSLLLLPVYATSKKGGSDEAVLETTCWTPAYFTETHERYTNALCGAKLRKFLRGEGQLGLYSIEIPAKLRDTNASNSEAIPLPLVLTGPDAEDIFVEAGKMMRKTASSSSPLVMKILILQMVLCLMLYFSTCCIKTSAGHEFANQKKQGHRDDSEKSELAACSDPHHVVGVITLAGSGRPALIYRILHVIAILVWVTLAFTNLYSFGIFSPLISEDGNSSEVSAPFLCDFTIRQMGSVHRHTVQCTFAVRGPSSSESYVKLVAQMNASLCVTLTLLGILHLAHISYQRRHGKTV